MCKEQMIVEAWRIHQWIISLIITKSPTCELGCMVNNRQPIYKQPTTDLHFISTLDLWLYIQRWYFLWCFVCKYQFVMDISVSRGSEMGWGWKGDLRCSVQSTIYGSYAFFCKNAMLIAVIKFLWLRVNLKQHM